MQRRVRHIASGMARLRKGAMMSCGSCSATASDVTASLTSSSTETSCPLAESSTNSRCVRLLNAWASSRMRIGLVLADARQLLAGQPVYVAPSTETRIHLHEVQRILDH